MIVRTESGFEQELAFEPCGPSAINETNTETPPATVSTLNMLATPDGDHDAALHYLRVGGLSRGCRRGHGFEQLGPHGRSRSLG